MANAFVVSDLPFVNALLVANGVPTLTGYQVTGPVRSQWRKLDPTGEFEDKWNRGASYIQMTFVDSPSSAVEISNPTNDTIMLTVDPCWLNTKIPLAYVLSAKELSNSCLVPSGQFRWAGAKVRVYQVKSKGVD